MVPFFSIILPTFNRAAFISRAIQSVMDQVFADWELLVVDDGSTDATDKVVKGFDDHRIKYRWQENTERSAARNRGMELAKGQYICFLDSDDYFLPHHLSSLHKAIKDNGQPRALFFVQTLREKEGELEKLSAAETNGGRNAEWLLGQSIGVPRWCGHRIIFEELQFDTAYRIGEDKELLMRIIQHYPIIPVDAWTAVFTEHPGRTINTDLVQNAKSHLQLITSLCQSNKSIGRDARRKAMANAWYNVGRSYAMQRNMGRAAMAFGRSSWYDPVYKFKRKVALLLGKT